MIVLDASLIVALLLREDNVPQPTVIFDVLRDNVLIVPAHWPVEIANALWANRRRGRIADNQLDIIVEELGIFNPIIEDGPSSGKITELIGFAESEKLTVYDAAYVQLASRSESTLATVDADMRAAAARLGIPVLPR